MATEGHDNGTVWNLTKTGGIIPSYKIVPLYIFRISNVIAGSALVLNILHIIVITSMPKVNFRADKNFKMYVIYLSILNIIMMINQLITDQPESQAYMAENQWSCVLSCFILHSSIIYAGWQLFLVSIERLIATVMPHKYPTYFCVRKFIVPLVTVHLAVIGVYGGLAVALHDRAFSVKGSGCCQMSGREFPKLSLLPSIEGFVIAGLITITYMILLAKRNEMFGGKSVNKTQSVMKRQLLLTIGALLMSKWCGWLPILATVAFRGSPYDKPIIDYVARLFLTGFSLMTPFAYGVTSTKYRKFVARSWTKRAQKSQDSARRQNETSEFDVTVGIEVSLSHVSDNAGNNTYAGEITENSPEKDGGYINHQCISDEITTD